MKKNILWILATIILAILFITSYFLYEKLQDSYFSDNSLSAPTEAQSLAAPDFIVQDNDGNNISLSSFIGKPIVLNFWASWCPPCKEEMPHFEKAYKEYPDIQFLMVNVTTSQRESLVKAKNHIAALGYTFPVYYDVDGNAAQAYNTYSLPVTYFIDREGNLVTYGVGMLNYETLINGINMIK